MKQNNHLNEERSFGQTEDRLLHLKVLKTVTVKKISTLLRQISEEAYKL